MKRKPAFIKFSIGILVILMTLNLNSTGKEQMNEKETTINSPSLANYNYNKKGEYIADEKVVGETGQKFYGERSGEIYIYDPIYGNDRALIKPIPPHKIGDEPNIIPLQSQ